MLAKTTTLPHVKSMTGHESHSQHHDDLPPEEVAQEGRRAQIELEARYLETCAVLRADTALLLAKHEALFSIGGWAIFNTHGEAIYSGYEHAGFLPRHETLIYTQPSSNGNGPSDIRLITNELFVHDETEERSYICEDFTLDHENDSQYSISALTFTDNAANPVGVAPVFWVNPEGALATINFTSFTKVRAVHDTSSAAKALPLGIYTNTEDKIHALSMGRNLIDAVLSLSPASKINPRQ